MKLKQEEKWDEAIEEFKKALEKSPGHAEALRGKSEASVLSSEAHYQKGLKRADKGELSEAISEFKISLRLDPNNIEAKKALEMALKTQEENERKAEEKYQTGLAYVREKKWEVSIEAFLECIELNRNHVLARSKLSESRNQIKAADERCDKGLVHLRNKEWNKALVEFRGAIEINPYHKRAKIHIDEAEGAKAEAVRFYESGNAFLNQRKWDDAIAGFRRSIDKDPNHEPAKAMLKKALEQGATERCLHGSKLLAKRDLAGAEKEFQDAFSYVPGFEEAKSGLADVWYQRGKAFEERKLLGNAVLEFKKADGIISGYRDSNQRIAACEQVIRERITCRVALLPFRNDSGDSAVGELVSEGILGSLINMKRENVEIIARSHLERVLREQQLNISVLADADVGRPSARIRGVDAIITGTVSSFELKNEERAQPTSVRYRSGTRQEYNPEYDRVYREYEIAFNNYERAKIEEEEYLERREQQMREAEERAEQAERRARRSGSIIDMSKSIISQMGTIDTDFSGGFMRGMGSIAAEERLRSAEERLARTPRYIQVPIYHDWAFTTYNCKKEASISVNSRVVDSATGKILFAETVFKNAVANDSYIDNPNPSAGVYPDLLELPSDMEMKERALADCIEEVSRKIDSSLGRFGIRYFVMGEMAASKSDVEGAVEEYLNFIVSSPEYKGAEMSKAKGYLREHRQFPYKMHERIDEKAKHEAPIVSSKKDEVVLPKPENERMIKSHEASNISSLGLTVQGLNAALAKWFGIEGTTGVIVTDVSKNMPAYRAGVKKGDIIVMFGGRRVRSIDDLRGADEEFTSKKQVVLMVFRKGVAGESRIVVGSD